MDNFLNKRFATPLLCFLSGSLCALGMAPYNVWPVFIIGFGVLYIAVSRAEKKRVAFGYGWLWAFGYFVFSLYWIGNALLVEGNPYKWAWPLAVCGLPALLAFFNAFSCLIAGRFLDLKRWYGYLGFVLLIGIFEWLRGHVFTGFPWNLYGYTWADTLPIAQIASLESVYLLTLLSVFWFTVVGFAITSKCMKSKMILGALVFITAASGFWFGHMRLQEDVAFHDDVTVKVIQPNTSQAEKWQRDKMDGHFQNSISLSQPSGDEVGKTLIIWPETTLSPAFLNSEHYRGEIARMLRNYNGEAILMTGALRYEEDTKTYYNSLLSIDEDGVVARIYDKSHLVPFGEYIPFQKWIPLAPIVQFQGFKKGQGLQDFQIFDGLHYSPLVCYEIIFPNKSTAKDTQADFIVNVTNDGWYGRSPGPHQHLVKTRFRAIEEGRPVLRAANTGISAIIDPYGRELHTGELFTQDILQSKLIKTHNVFAK